MRILLPGIRYFTGQKSNFFKNLAEFAYFLFKRQSWVFDFERYWNDFEDIKINKPVFILGTEGGGLTMIARMLGRHKNMVSVSGGYKNWAGPEEMDIVLGPVLPKEFVGRRRRNCPEGLRKLGLPANGIYASDEFLSHYRKSAADVTPQVKNKFRKIIRWRLARGAEDKNTAIFFDKSQINTVKVSFINEILKDTNPKFLLVTRDPYVMAFKFAPDSDIAYYDKMGWDRKKALQAGAEHWKNSMKCALEDGGRVENFLCLKLEDILEEPEKKMRKICDFIEIDFNNDMLPQPHHCVPFGAKSKDKWYPMIRDVNKKYCAQMSKEDVGVIHGVVGEYAALLGYSKPNVGSLTSYM